MCKYREKVKHSFPSIIKMQRAMTLCKTKLDVERQEENQQRSLVSLVIDRKQPPEVFYTKGILKNFAIFTGIHLCWSLFVKLQAFRHATLLKRYSSTGVFRKYCEYYKYCEIFRTPILKNICERLLLIYTYCSVILL